MAAHPYPRSRQGMAARPAAENLGGEFLFDVEGEMAEAEGPLRSVSLYVQPLTGKRRTVVCKHWLRGLCKKGDLCDYLHEYDEDKMPICQFYFSDKGECNKQNCPFKHSLPTDNAPECPWFSRGFCKKGPYCKMKHVKRKKCVDYADYGFCIKGPECKFGHPNVDKSVDLANLPGHNNRGGIVVGQMNSGFAGRGGGGFRGGGRGGGGFRGGGGGKGPPWKCPQCQNVNYNFRVQCNRCKMAKPAQAEAVEDFPFIPAY